MDNKFERNISLKDKIEVATKKLFELTKKLEEGAITPSALIDKLNKLYLEYEELNKEIDKFKNNCPDTKEEWAEYEYYNKPVMDKWAEIMDIQNNLHDCLDAQDVLIKNIDKTKIELFNLQHSN